MINTLKFVELAAFYQILKKRARDMDEMVRDTHNMKKLQPAAEMMTDSTLAVKFPLVVLYNDIDERGKLAKDRNRAITIKVYTAKLNTVRVYSTGASLPNVLKKLKEIWTGHRRQVR